MSHKLVGTVNSNWVPDCKTHKASQNKNKNIDAYHTSQNINNEKTALVYSLEGGKKTQECSKKPF